MGSLADVLGDQLRAGLAQLVDPDASDEAPDAAAASSESAAETAQDRAREAAALDARAESADFGNATPPRTRRTNVSRNVASDVSSVYVTTRRKRSSSVASEIGGVGFSWRAARM